MSNDSMGNLEKLGILVIVILVVVVGVVAITPSDTLFPDDGRTDVATGGDGEAIPKLLPIDDERGALRGTNGATDQRSRGSEMIWPVVDGYSGDGDSGDGASYEDSIPSGQKDHEFVEKDGVGSGTETLLNVAPPKPESPVAIEPVTLRDEPSYRVVTIQSGDTFTRIAQRELNDGRRFPELVALNPSVNPRRLHVGGEVRVPTGSARVGGGDAATDLAARAPRGRSTGETTYVVQPGQTAGDISLAVYGTSKLWKPILDHNGIDDPRRVQAGRTLRIPPKPTTSTGSDAPAASSAPTIAAARGATVPGSYRSYTVQPGETPGEIAANELGDFSRWPEVLTLNGLKSERDLQAGAVIRLPR